MFHGITFHRIQWSSVLRRCHVRFKRLADAEDDARRRQHGLGILELDVRGGDRIAAVFEVIGERADTAARSREIAVLHSLVLHANRQVLNARPLDASHMREEVVRRRLVSRVPDSFGRTHSS